MGAARIGFLGLAALAAEACATQLPLDDVISRNAAARGGAPAIEAIENVRTKVEIVEPSFTVVGDYRARDGAMRIDIYAGGARVFSEGIDELGSWQQKGAGEPILETTKEGRAALLHGIEFNLFGLHQLEERGHTLAQLGSEQIDGTDYRVIRVTMSDGFETYLYLHSESALVERRRDVRALHPDADATTRLIENRYFDFRTSCGVLSPASSQQIDVETGEELQRTRVLSQVCNLAEEALQMGRNTAVD